MNITTCGSAIGDRVAVFLSYTAVVCRQALIYTALPWKPMRERLVKSIALVQTVRNSSAVLKQLHGKSQIGSANNETRGPGSPILKKNG